MTEPRDRQQDEAAGRDVPFPSLGERALDHHAEAMPDERPAEREAVFELRDVTVSYSGKPAVREIGFDVARNEITALIGPSGCGKSTLIRCLNRMNDLIPGALVEGSVFYHGQDLY